MLYQHLAQIPLLCRAKQLQLRIMRHIWQLDDTQYWHLISDETIRQLSNWQLRSFYTSQDLLYGLEECRAEPQYWPSIILMDFYLQNERGDQVTQAIRSYVNDLTASATDSDERQALQRHITIVGFSSVRSCSEQICQAGGDCIVKKIETGDGINHQLLKYVQNYPLP